MQKTILELNAEEVRQYFLKSSRFCTIELPKYFDFQKLLDKLEKIINKQTVFDITQKGNSKQPQIAQRGTGRPLPESVRMPFC